MEGSGVEVTDEVSVNGAGPSGGNRPRVCVIGAGSSGITALRSLKERGIEYECFEKGSYIGGNWKYDNDNDQSAAY